MRKIFSLWVVVLLALCAHTANAGPILAIQAIGNVYDSYAANWYPDHPGMSPEEYAAGNFTHTMMFDLDSCKISNINGMSGDCTRMREMVNAPVWNIVLDSQWSPLVSGYAGGSFGSGLAGFSISRTSVNSWVSAKYIDKPIPDDFEYPEMWGNYINGVISGEMVSQYGDVSEIYNKKLRVRQGSLDWPHNPNASLNAYLWEPNEGGFIFETGFEFAKVYFVPEPNSLALMGLAMAGLAFARRRKV